MRNDYVARQVVAGFCLFGFSELAVAANSVFQDFFTNACRSPTAALAARCGETDSALGNLSGDSESSLNPSQVLAATDGVVGNAQTTMDRVAALQDESKSNADNAIEFGRFSVGVQVHGAWENRDGHPNFEAERAYDNDRSGLDLTLDYRVTDRVVLGSALSYRKGELQFEQERFGNNFTPASSAGDIESEELGLGLFVLLQPTERLHIEVAAGYDDLDQDVTRLAVFQESRRGVPQTNVRTEGSPSGNHYWGSVGGGIDLNWGAWNTGLSLGIFASRAQIDGYAEADQSVSGLPMQFEENERDSLLGSVIVTGQRVITSDIGVIVPTLRAKYMHEFEDDRDSVEASLVLDAAQNVLQLAGERQQQHRVALGASLQLVLPNGWLPFIDYEGIYGSEDLSRHQVVLGLKKELGH